MPPGVSGWTDVEGGGARDFRMRKKSFSPGDDSSHLRGEKLVMTRGEDRHWIEYPVRDDIDNGTIVDLVQHRWSLGDVRCELRPWMGSGSGGAVARTALERYGPQPGRSPSSTRARHCPMLGTEDPTGHPLRDARMPILGLVDRCAARSPRPRGWPAPGPSDLTPF